MFSRGLLWCAPKANSTTVHPSHFLKDTAEEFSPLSATASIFPVCWIGSIITQTCYHFLILKQKISLKSFSSYYPLSQFPLQQMLSGSCLHSQLLIPLSTFSLEPIALMLHFPGHQRASSCQTQRSIFLLISPSLLLTQRLIPSSWKRFLPPGLQKLHSPGFATSLATILNYFVGSPHLLSHHLSLGGLQGLPNWSPCFHPSILQSALNPVASGIF